MKSEQDILAALRALAEADREKEASGEVETRLRLAFRRKHTARSWKRPAWMLAAAAALVAMIATYMYERKPATIAVASPVKQSPVMLPEQAAPVAEIARVQPRPARRQVAKHSTPRQEIVTDFFPLIDVAPPFERGELVRVNLPASAMRTVGLPVREERLSDRVQADVLVGQEGMPRAIRFVKYSQ